MLYNHPCVALLIEKGLPSRTCASFLAGADREALAYIIVLKRDVQRPDKPRTRT